MDDDRTWIKNLTVIAEDGREGYAWAAKALADSDRPELADTFTAFSRQREQFADQLRAFASTYESELDSDDLPDHGSVSAAVHRGWMAVKHTLTGSDSIAILSSTETGEEHAISEYDQALDANLSPDLRSLLQRQHQAITAALTDVRALQSRM